jgi:surface protein
MTTHLDLKIELDKTILPMSLSNIIIKYTESNAKVEYEDKIIIYVNQAEFDILNCKEIISIDIYGLLFIKKCGKFYGSKIQNIKGLLTIIGDAKYMFADSLYFKGCDNMNDWDVSNVTNMQGMFNNTLQFNGDISNWNVSNVIDMSFMFDNAKIFNGDISNWNVSNVTDMSFMFDGAKIFNRNISGWYIKNANVTKMF